MTSSALARAIADLRAASAEAAWIDDVLLAAESDPTGESCVVCLAVGHQRKKARTRYVRSLDRVLPLCHSAIRCDRVWGRLPSRAEAVLAAAGKNVRRPKPPATSPLTTSVADDAPACASSVAASEPHSPVAAHASVVGDTPARRALGDARRAGTQPPTTPPSGL